MGTTYFDSEGKTTFLFNHVPIYSVKKAFFKDKLGTVHTLLKMIYNSVTYDFRKTAEGGAVIFANNYTGWEFIAPDDRLDFEGYTNMTLSEALSAVRTKLAENPIPSWDRFAGWVYESGSYPKIVVSKCTAYIKPIGGSSTQIGAPDFTAMAGGSFVDFLDVLITALEDSSLNMPNFKTGDTSFACMIDLFNNDSTLISMTFKFRE